VNSAFLPLFPLPDGHVETESRLVVHPRCPPDACPVCCVQFAIDELRSGRPHLDLGHHGPRPHEAGRSPVGECR
jgi:hypothetical protein